MLAYLKGKIINKIQNYIILCPENIGYKVSIGEKLFSEININEEIELYIYQHIREDSSQLFGFSDTEELEMFELLISISGIGPKAALGILTIASPKAIKTAIIKEDPSILTRVSGVGKKTAERVILELQSKVDEMSEIDKQEAQTNQEVIEALITMGYNVGEAREATKAIPQEISDISEKIKLALKSMKK